MEKKQQKKDDESTSEKNMSAENGYNILLVDDDMFLLDMYSMKFSQEGHTVEACKSVDEALSVLRGGFQADAIVLDLVMPGKDGLALLREIDEGNLAKGAARIVFTNQGEESERKKIESLGVDEFIVKASSVPSEAMRVVVDMIRKKQKA